MAISASMSHEVEHSNHVIAARKPRRVIDLISIPGAALLFATASASAADARGGWYMQGGVAEQAESLVVGASRDWRWQATTRYGQITGQWQIEVGRWRSDVGGHTQLGLTPALRLSPASWGKGWFIEGGIGLNVITPTYRTRDKRFSTSFNFGDHLAIGKRWGGQEQHEWSIRLQHFSNAGIKKPNPGENFLQFRYTRRL